MVKIKKGMCSLLSGVVLVSGLAPSAVVLGAAVPMTERYASNDELRLWYTSPAENSHYGWENYSLPIGNGHMGATIFGGTQKERIQFNEKTLWTGGPSESRVYDYGNIPGKYEVLQDVRELFKQGKDEEAAAKTGQLVGKNADVEANGFGDYQNFGDLFFDFSFNPNQIENYVRDLDLNTAIATVDFDYQGIGYKREYFMNYPDNVMVMKFTATEKESIDFDLSFVSAQGGVPIYEGDQILLRGELKDNQMIYESQVKVIPTGGKVTSESDKIKVEDADEVLILMTAGTNYKDNFPVYRGEDPHKSIVDRIEKATQKGYEALLTTHLQDYQEIFSRVKLDLEHQIPNIPTDELLAKYKRGEISKYLEILLFQYGRYLTIASSRAGSLPSNLQGVWNDSNTPPWNCDYHLDVNLQMNYWPTYSTNMIECAIPLIEYVDSLRAPGRITAEIYTGIKSEEENPENGFMLNAIANPFGWTAPGHETYWGWAPGAGAWITQNVWDYYDYSRDTDYLAEAVYPIMREQARFWQQHLIYDKETDRMADIPSISPEQGNVSKGTTYSQELAWQLFSDTIEAAKVLGVDEELSQEWEVLKDQVKPLYIGEDGQIKEWYEETTLGSMNSDRQHRHVSHLLGLFPGDHISKETPEYLEAAKVSLNDRGDRSTGWAMGHRINLWARTGDGERTYQLVQELLKYGILNNLWDTHAPFQIDGNFGMTSGVAEMIMQSHLGYIELLPSMPEAWGNGNVEGLVARGNFVVDMDWHNGYMTDAKVTARNGGTCTLKYKDMSLAEVTTLAGQYVPVKIVSSEEIAFDTEKGETYVITFSSQEGKVEMPKDVIAYRIGDEDVEVSWKQVKNADKYKIYRSVNYGNFQLIGTTNQKKIIDSDADVQIGKVSYKVSAIVNGKESPLTEAVRVREIVTPGFINDTHSAIAYSRRWAQWYDSGYLGGSCHYIDEADETTEDTIDMGFVGTGIEVYAATTNRGAYIDVYIDGRKYAEDISLYTPTNQKQVKVFEETGLTYGIHHIQVVTTDKKGPMYPLAKVDFEGFKVLNNAQKVELITVNSESGAYVIGEPNGTLKLNAKVQPESAENKEVTWTVTDLEGNPTTIANINQEGLLSIGIQNGKVIVTAKAKDGSEVLGSVEIDILVQSVNETWINDTDSTIIYSPQWHYYKESPYYRGDCHYTDHYGDQAPTIDYTFEGTGIGVYMAVNTPSSIQGLVDIAIDDQYVATYDLGGALADLKQVKVFEELSLEDTTHTITLTAKTREAGKDQAIFDFFKVYKPISGYINKIELNKELNQVASLNEKKYTETSWSNLKEKWVVASEVMNNTTVTQEEVNKAALTLKQAREELELKDLSAIIPVPPTALRAIGIMKDSVLLTWKPSINDIDIKAYAIYENDIRLAETTDLSKRIEGLSPGTEYTFKIVAIGENDKESEATSVLVKTLEQEDINAPTSPEKLTITDETENSVTLTWQAAVDTKKVITYEIYLNGEKQGETVETSYSLEKLLTNVDYTAKVRAIDENGNVSIPNQIRFRLGDEVESIVGVLQGKEEVESGEVFEVSVGITNAKDSIYAMDAQIEYDKELFELKGVNGIEPTLLVGNKKEEGLVRILSSTPKGIVEAQEMIVIQFKVKETDKDRLGKIKINNIKLGSVIEQEGIVSDARENEKVIAIKGKTSVDGGLEDINKDGKIDVADLALVAYYYQTKLGDDTWEEAKKADVNKDEIVGVEDLSLIANAILSNR